MTSNQTLSRLRLRTGTPVLDRGDGEVQLGTDPRWALRLAGLAAAEVAWLRDLAYRRHTSPLASADRLGVDPVRREEITTVLLRAGFLHPLTSAGRATAVLAPGDGAADAPALGALRPDGAGGATLARRARATVAVASLGRLGAAVAMELATAGVGTVVIPDTAPVQTTDLGLCAYAPTDVGQPRNAALGAAIARITPHTRVLPDGAADVIVLVEAHAPAPARGTRLVGAGVTHLLVTVREADVVVGPFVLPGVTACGQCADLHRSDDDPAWPALVTQLRQVTEPPQETALAAGAAALASAQVLAHLDGLRPASAGALVELALPQVLPVMRDLAPHPRCGCVTLSCI